MQIPLTAYELIDELDLLFPEVIFDTTIPQDEFLMKTGERRLVLMLKAIREREITEQRQPGA